MADLREFYQTYLNLISPNRFIVRQLIKDCLKGEKADTCLDIGAGTSPYRTQIEQTVGCTNYLSTDLTVTRGTSFCTSALNLPLADGSVDAVASFDVIQHLDDSASFLEEISRVLKDSGFLVLSYPFSYGECDQWDYKRWSKLGIETDLKKYGFEIHQHKLRGGFFLSLAYICINLIASSLPGARQNWHTTGSTKDYIRIGLSALLTLPFNLAGFLCLLLDALLPSTSFYIGGVVIARIPKKPLDKLSDQ